MDVGKYATLEADQVRYIRNVLRLKTGDELILFDGQGDECKASIREFTTEAAVVEILKKRSLEKDALKITLIQSLPKRPKMDDIVEKVSELGVHKIVPCLSSRSVPRLSDDKAKHRTERWQKIAVEASRRCGRADVPSVAQDIKPFDEALKIEEQGLKIIFWEEETALRIKEVLRDNTHAEISNFSIVVGPEGGFTADEVRKAEHLGYLSVSLGPLVLKVETAAVSILTIMQYERGFLG
jgi:16S rRNA (uracil1498-N3)-methyltransferase